MFRKEKKSLEAAREAREHEKEGRRKENESVIKGCDSQWNEGK